MFVTQKNQRTDNNKHQLTLRTLLHRTLSTDWSPTNTATVSSSVLVTGSGVACKTLPGGWFRFKWYGWVDHSTSILYWVWCTSKLISDLLYVLASTYVWSSYFPKQNPTVQEGHINHVVKDMHWPSSAGCFHRVHSHHLIYNIHTNLRFVVEQNCLRLLFRDGRVNYRTSLIMSSVRREAGLLCWHLSSDNVVYE